MPKNHTWTLRELIITVVAVTFVLFVHGAVPLVMMPTLGQAVWSMGFSQSFANGAFLDFYAHDFGIPHSAAIAFGLAGAWPASLLIRLGLHPADAYAGMAAIWLSLAMFSAYLIARQFGATRSIALLGAATWMSMPIIWTHAGYSMLSLGFALLAFYFMTAIKLFSIDPDSMRITTTTIILYFSVALVAVFMDGYTFMMFATGSSILFVYFFITRPEIRQVLVRVSMPVHMASFALAYVLFSVYIGKSNFVAQQLDFFRGWGLDLSFIAIPTKGVLWLPDLLGLSLKRTDNLYFGDGSVWGTTFALPVLVFGLLAWWRARRQIKISTGVLLVVVFGLYMALGPSLKINSTKPESLQISHPGQQSALMPSEYAVFPTGNAWISETLPGFNVMRASYRWSALGIFGLWLLIMIWMSRTNKEDRRLWMLALFFVILFNLPDLQKRWQVGIDNRDMFLQIDRDLVTKLRQHIRAGETVAFIPWGNDFIANYLAPKVGFRTYNIGGDKNLAAAQYGWPSEMLALGGEINTNKILAVLTMLIDGTADVLVLPYFHMLWSPHLWPCVDQSTATLSDKQKEDLRSIPGFLCPPERRAELQPVLLALQDSPYIEVFESSLYATVRLRPEFSGSKERSALINTIFKNIHYPLVLGADFENRPYILGKGWHGLEAHHVWSQSDAKLTLPVPKECESKICDAVLQFVVFGASPQRTVSVLFNCVDQGLQWSEKIVATSGDSIQVKVPLTSQKAGRQEISISVPDATSPMALSGSPDGRVLGIALQRIDLSNK